MLPPVVAGPRARILGPAQGGIDHQRSRIHQQTQDLNTPLHDRLDSSPIGSERGSSPNTTHSETKMSQKPKDPIIVRVQTRVGVWRIEQIPLATSFGQLKERIAAEYSVPEDKQRICSDFRGKSEIKDETTFTDLHARNGHKVFFFTDVEIGAGGGTGVKTTVDKNGNLVLKTAGTEKRGFRPGLLPLSNIKRSWKISEMDQLDSQYTYEFKEPVKLECENCVMESNVAIHFITYVKQSNFAPRVAFLYGRYDDANNSTIVHASYEPPQKVDEFGALEVLPEEPDAQTRLDAVVNGLGLEKVGCMFCHPMREGKHPMNSIELLFAVEQQLESCGGDIEKKPNRFVTMVVQQREDNTGDFQPYQITRQGMEMVAKGMLLWGIDNPYHCDIHEMFTAITVKHNKEKTRVMKNEDKSVPVEFFVKPVHISLLSNCVFLPEMSQYIDFGCSGSWGYS